MSKILKSLLIVIIISLITFSMFINHTVQATSDSYENISDSSDDYIDDEDDDSNNNVVKQNSSDSGLQTLSPSSVTSVTSKENYSQANLELNNILCIILISIGVLLILFAIAILVRIKR